MQARWAISPDETFEPVGSKSCINYWEDFLWYRDYILEALDNNKIPMLSTVLLWNRVIFPAMFQPQRNAGGSASMDRLRNLMLRDAEVTNDEDDNMEYYDE